MSQDMLLEIGVEEIPSELMPGALEGLRTMAANKLQQSHLEFGEITTLGTPRRLVLHVKGLGEKQKDTVIENRGPKQSSAFNQDGTPSKAALGFARSQGIDVDELEIRDVGGVEYVYAVKKESGGRTVELLPTLLTEIIKSMNFLRSMRWGYFQTRFARPIRWLLAFFGDQLLSIRIENIESADWTMGHRFLSSGPLKVAGIDEYYDALRNNYVIVDQLQRKDMIWSQVREAATRVGGTAMENEDLLNEVSYLVEYPTAFYGEFSKSYLDVPAEVLTTSMISHQRYFPLFAPDQNLMAGFIGVRNGTDYCLDLVKAGNERVLKARLEDALFFWKEDTSKPLADSVPGLKDVLFHEKLGSILDKVECLRDLAVSIGENLGLSDKDNLDRAAFLCKADLLSSMVYEFPELQGIMGRYYARRGGENNEVAEAILEHYLPKFAGDRLPASATGIVLALAEKLFNLTAFFAMGIKPSGSQDPYALRRQALGVVYMIIDLQLTARLRVLITETHAVMTRFGFQLKLDAAETAEELMEFILQRMRGVMLDRGYTYDLIDAVLYQGLDDLRQIVGRADAIKLFKESQSWEDFMVVFNRSHNLSKKWLSAEVRAESLVDVSEKTLYTLVDRIKPGVEAAFREYRYEEGLAMLAELRPAVDNFFEAVMVMVDDQDLRGARLGLLKLIADLGNSLADFTKILQ
ncbi:MAG: glycine--tRNA ligase subunit beta [Syntrophomonadaceae bacterium]